MFEKKPVNLRVKFKRIYPVSIIVELIAGKFSTTLERLVALYRLDSLMVAREASAIRCKPGPCGVWRAKCLACQSIASRIPPYPSSSLARRERSGKYLPRDEPIQRGTYFDELMGTKTQNRQHSHVSLYHTSVISFICLFLCNCYTH